MPMKLQNVYRLDSLPLTQAHYTEEGYLVDRPILTTAGIFEYRNPDGSVRRELRLPEDVFEPDSLSSYKGKPIIITHDAGLVTKDNVGKEQVGTILSAGYRTGDDVRAEIIIHDTDAMKSRGFKELSLGYNLDLDETPGEWNGQPYDAIQRKIRINHLALVYEARAGEQARLNIDSRDPQHPRILKGAKKMSNKTTRGDGLLSPEELKKAVAEYKERRAQRLAGQSKEDGDDFASKGKVESVEPVTPNNDATETETAAPATIEDKVNEVKENRDRRDQDGEPEDKDSAMKVIAQQDEDIETLFDIIDTLLAKMDFDSADPEGTEAPGVAEPVTEPEENTDGVEPAPEEDPEGGVQGDCGSSCKTNKDSDGEEGETEPVAKETTGGTEKLNTDSIDQIVRQRIKLGMLGQKLNMDGLENMTIMDAKKAVINAVRPTLRLDGKGATYIDAIFELAADEVNSAKVKDVNYQKRQMFNKDTADWNISSESSSTAARNRMISRQKNKKEAK